MPFPKELSYPLADRPRFLESMGTNSGVGQGSDKMVEAGGIEPPSEDRQTMATTRLVRDFELADRPPTDGLPASQPI